MEWRQQSLRLDLDGLSLDVCNYTHGWVAYAHLKLTKELHACENVGGLYGSLAEAQAAAHAYAEQLGPVAPWLALFAFFRFDRDRPTRRRVAGARATLRKARKRKAAA